MTTLARARVRAGAGAAAFLVGSVLVHAGNYAFNLVAVRFLAPEQYADVALAVTLLLFAGFVTVSFQMATARTVAELADEEDLARAVGRWFGRRAFWFGLVLGGSTAMAAPVLASIFTTGSVLPFLAVALALPWAFSTGVGRGLAQGLQHFGRLAVSFQAEMLVRLGVGAGLVVAGVGVAGALGGLVTSLVAAALTVRPRTNRASEPSTQARRRLAAALWPSLALLIGEALVVHSDTIVVKAAFDPAAAGEFAAVALLGRAVFFVTLPISMLVYPAAAARAARGEPTRPLLVAAVAAVGAVGAAATALAAFASRGLVEMVLGSGYLAQAHLLAPYAAATALFACAATIISFAIATGSGAAGLGAAGAGLTVILTLSVLHSSLAAVVWVQVGLMAVYLGLVSLWAFRRTGAAR